MKKIKILLILSFLAILSPVSALETNYWGKDVKAPLEVYFRDCTSTMSCPTVLSNVNGVGYFNDSYSNLNTSFDVILGSNFGIQTIFKPEQSLVKDFLYNLSIYSCTSSGSDTSSVLNLLNLTTGSSLNEVMNYSNSINVISSSSSVVSDRPFNYFILSEGTSQMTLFDTCSMYNILFVPSKNSTYIGAHNKVSVKNTTDFTFLGYNLENLGQYNQLSADQIQNIISNNNEVIKQQIDQMNNDISSSLDDLKDQQEKNNQELIDHNKENWKDNMQNCRDSHQLFNNTSTTDYVSQGITTTFSDNTYTLSGTLSSTSWANLTPKFATSLPVGTYTISIDNPQTFKVVLKLLDIDSKWTEIGIPIGRTSTTFTTTKSFNQFYLYIGSSVGTTINTSFKFQLQKGSKALPIEEYGKEVCTNKIDDVKDSLTNDDIGDSDNKLGDFLTGYEDKDATGLSGIVSAPLRVIKAFSTAQCKSFEVTLYKDFKATVPCVQSMLSETTKKSAQFKLFQSLETGFVAYCCVKSLYNMVQKIKNPDDDKVEVLDL